MVKHTQTIRRQKPTKCLSMFDDFVGFAFKGLRKEIHLEINAKKFDSTTNISWKFVKALQKINFHRQAAIFNYCFKIFGFDFKFFFPFKLYHVKNLQGFFDVCHIKVSIVST